MHMHYGKHLRIRSFTSSTYLFKKKHRYSSSDTLSRTIGEPNNLKIFGSKKSNRLKQDSQNMLWKEGFKPCWSTGLPTKRTISYHNASPQLVQAGYSVLNSHIFPARSSVADRMCHLDWDDYQITMRNVWTWTTVDNVVSVFVSI